jgi:nitrogen regulatory protein P-II 1
MKCLTIITHTDDQQELINQLRTIEQVQGFSLSHVEGHGQEPEHDAFLSARDDVVGSTPRVRADIVLQDSDVDTVLDALRNVVGARYWITAVEQEGHL